jgi:sterol desaturase/sphingolipid hydroxylase (fatty acid hydroxylase superfamily)
MDDTLYGRRDQRGHWRPLTPLRYPPVFVLPPRPAGFLRWLFGYDGYLWPWNALYAAIAVLFWLFLTPSLATMRHFAFGWIAFLLARNVALVLIFYGAFHWRLYVQKAQGAAFKFNGKWPDGNPAFLFGSQTADNMIWTLASALPIWTGYEAVTMWAFANGYIGYVDAGAHPYAFAIVLLATPLFREVHFYFVHRLIHWPPLYRTVHKLHHKNINPGPWSGLAMHPMEHLLYFSAVLIHWIVPSHPIHAIFNLVHLGLAPAPGHVGFGRIVVGGENTFDTHCYAHYLHHKHFECNYSDGAIPLDKWFGSFHDGSEEASEALKARFLAAAAKKREQEA